MSIHLYGCQVILLRPFPGKCPAGRTFPRKNQLFTGGAGSGTRGRSDDGPGDRILRGDFSEKGDYQETAHIDEGESHGGRFSINFIYTSGQIRKGLTYPLIQVWTVGSFTI